MIYVPSGYIADPVGHVRAAFSGLASALGLSSSALPRSTSNCAEVDAVCGVRNQKQTTRCTGFAVAKATAATLALAGTPLGFYPSPTRLFTNGRRLEVPFGPPLTDTGAMPWQVWGGASKFGITAWDDAIDGPDVSPDVLNADPGADDLLSESSFLAVGEYGLSSAGSARILDLRMALAAKRYVTVALCASSDAIQYYAGDVLTGAMLGTDRNHYMVIEDYAFLPNGELVFLMGQSWGQASDVPPWGVDRFAIDGLPPGWRAPGRILVDSTAVQTMGDLVIGDIKIRSAA